MEFLEISRECNHGVGGMDPIPRTDTDRLQTFPLAFCQSPYRFPTYDTPYESKKGLEKNIIYYCSGAIYMIPTLILSVAQFPFLKHTFVRAPLHPVPDHTCPAHDLQEFTNSHVMTSAPPGPKHALHFPLGRVSLRGETKIRQIIIILNLLFLL